MIKLKRGRICDGRMGRSTVELREPLRFSDLCFAKKELNASFFMWWSQLGGARAGTSLPSFAAPDSGDRPDVLSERREGRGLSEAACRSAQSTQLSTFDSGSSKVMESVKDSEARKRGTTTYCTHIITGYRWLADDMRSRRGTSPSHHVPPRPTPHKYTRDC